MFAYEFMVWLSLRSDWHCQFVKLQTPDHCIKEEYTTVFITKSRCHLVRTVLDFPKESLNRIVRSYHLPVFFGKRVRGQASI